MIKIIRSDERYRKDSDWLTSYHHFSFAEYFDPKKMNFGPLRVFNDDIMQPATGFDLHFHRDMEIITYVIEGELEHKDNQGNQGVIHTGELQTMSAGSGIMHSEYNPSKEKPVRLLQMWIFADTKNLSPSWEQKRYTREHRLNRLLPVIMPLNGKESNSSALHIHQDASFYISTLTSGAEVDHKLKNERKAYVFVIDGEIRVNGTVMQTGDAAMVDNESSLFVNAVKPAELIMIDLPEKYTINR